MNIYFLSRWGNGEDEDGPDASFETNMIVRASDVNRASELADPYLERLARKTEFGREVAMFTQLAVQIGTTSEAKEVEGVVCLPWYGNSLPQDCVYVWKRDLVESGWETHEEYHGEPPYFSNIT